MGLSGSRINEENRIVNESWIAWLIDDSIGTILSVPFCPLPFCPRTVLLCANGKADKFLKKEPGKIAMVLDLVFAFNFVCVFIRAAEI